MPLNFNELLQRMGSQNVGQPQGQGVASQDPSIFGGSNQFLQNMFRRQSTGVNPAIAQAQKAFGAAQGRITDRGIRNIRESQAGSGFRGGGANLFNDLFAGQAQARAGAEAGFAQQQTDFNQFAQGQLGMLNQFQGGQQFGQLGLNEAGRQFNINDIFRNRQLQEQQRQFDESQPGFWDIVGMGVGGASQALPFALSDRRLKENIHKTGDKTKDGIPIVTYNYKDDPLKIKYTGVIAQDVEKVKPRAVVKAVDYSKLGEI